MRNGKVRYLLFINLRFQQILNLQLAALFYKNLCLAAGKFAHSTVCSNNYALFLKNKRIISGNEISPFDGEKLAINESIVAEVLNVLCIN